MTNVSSKRKKGDPTKEWNEKSPSKNRQFALPAYRLHSENTSKINATIFIPSLPASSAFRVKISMRNLEALARILRRKTMRSNMAEQNQSEDSRTTGQPRRKACQEHGDEDCPSENERELESLEYEEDVYYSKLTSTPSFDDIDELGDDVDELVVHCWRDSNGEIDEIVVDDGNLTTETEHLPGGSGSCDSGANGGRRKRRSVRVIFQDLSKPYLAKIVNSQNYKKFLELVKGAAGERKRDDSALRRFFASRFFISANMRHLEGEIRWDFVVRSTSCGPWPVEMVI